ncbi:hypothetical protein GFY24_33530 [Nocardia sp. SYP-A9097]|uniref:hypothetical protein n=1 Tax=Nocardia sp. SYP-A9097 TaxID=2663237 RepID=UPI00129AA083|nr:hypothetical protein [Nocardia sp. SYP-A9097]MRH92301.1 hypothetical protein [Nocardia sp. SYP-A9097]
MSEFEYELLGLWDRLRAVRESGALEHYQRIRSELVALEPIAQALDEGHSDEFRALMLYSYLRAGGKAAVDDQARRSMQRHAYLENRLLAACDQVREARCLADYAQVATTLDDIGRCGEAFEPDSLPMWALPRLYAYVTNLCEREEKQAVRDLLTATKGRSALGPNSEGCVAPQYRAAIDILASTPAPNVQQARQLIDRLERIDHHLETGARVDIEFAALMDLRNQAWATARRTLSQAREADEKAMRAAVQAGFAHPPSAAVRRRPQAQHATTPTHGPHGPSKSPRRERDLGYSL